MGVGVCWVNNVERREEVLSSALATAPPGSFFCLSCHVTGSAKGKKKDLLVPKGIIEGRRGRQKGLPRKRKNYFLCPCEHCANSKWKYFIYWLWLFDICYCLTFKTSTGVGALKGSLEYWYHIIRYMRVCVHSCLFFGFFKESGK